MRKEFGDYRSTSRQELPSSVAKHLEKLHPFCVQACPVALGMGLASCSWSDSYSEVIIGVLYL